MENRASDRLLVLGALCFAGILFYGLVVEKVLLSLVVVLLLVVVRALYKILAALSRIEHHLADER